MRLLRYPQLDQLHRVFMADIVEKARLASFMGASAFDIGIRNRVNLLRHDSRRERIQRVVRAVPRRETIRETEKVLFINLIENRFDL